MSDQLLTVLKFALMAVLYLFFLRVVRAVWAELKEPAPMAAPPMPAPPMPHAMPVAASAPPTVAVRGAVAAPPATDLRLVVVDPAGARGRTFPLGLEGPADVTIGRAVGCGLAFPEDTFVSQLHARLFRTDGAWQIEDLGSTNGTFLNRDKVSAPRALRPGDQIQVGRTVLEVAP
jgi:hypothetical protein